MGLHGLVGILQFFLLLFAVVLVVLIVMFVGAILVAGVSLPALLVLPTVRRQFVTLVERTGGVRPDSVTDWRFLGVYLLSVYAYGITLFVTFSALAEHLGTYGWPVPDGRIGWLLGVAVVALFGVGLLVVRPSVTRRRLRTVGEWTVFLCLLSGLVVVAAFVVPYLLFNVLGPLVW